MLSTSLSQDLYRRFLRPGATDQQVLSVARGAAIGGGIAGIGLAAIIPTVIGALSIFYGLLTVVVFVPIVAALHLRRAGPPEALASVLAGVTVLVATHLHTGGAALAGWRPETLGLGTAGAAFALVLAVRMETARMIEVKGLTRVFDNRVAVEDVSLEVGQGEIFGLLGPNGAGKTTTLRMLAGLISPSSGEAMVAGVPLVRERMNEVRGKVGFLTEAPGLWDRLTVKLNLLVYARLYGVKNPERAVSDALGMFGLEDRAGSLAAQLSKGMKQKVAIARALLHSPPVLLLDEPTSGLDPADRPTRAGTGADAA